MTTPSSQAGNRASGGTLSASGKAAPAGVLRAAADFVESAGLRSGFYVLASDREVRIHVSQPYEDPAARYAAVTRLAGLIGGTIRQDDNRNYPAADLRADGVIGSLPAVVETSVLVRRARSLTGLGKPFARQPDGQITAVPGKLPAGWRWVTELDARPRHAAPRKPAGIAASALPEANAVRLAAHNCPPLTGAALHAAARQATAAQPVGPGATAHRAPVRPR